MKTITDETTKTLLLDEVCNFFKNSPTESAFKGTTFQFFRLMVSNPLNNGMPIDMHSVGRVLDALTKSRHIQYITTEDVWSISRSQLTHILQHQQMNITTIQPNTLDEQIYIRQALREGLALEANALGNDAAYPTGWIDIQTNDPDFSRLRFRIKRKPEYTTIDGTPAPLPDYNKPAAVGALTERELLAIMSAIIMGTGVDHFTSPASAVLSAKRILFSIDNPASNDYKAV